MHVHTPAHPTHPGPDRASCLGRNHLGRTGLRWPLPLGRAHTLGSVFWSVDLVDLSFTLTPPNAPSLPTPSTLMTPLPWVDGAWGLSTAVRSHKMSSGVEAPAILSRSKRGRYSCRHLRNGETEAQGVHVLVLGLYHGEVAEPSLCQAAKLLPGLFQRTSQNSEIATWSHVMIFFLLI